MYMLLSVTVEDVASTVQDLEIKGNPVNVTGLPIENFNSNTHLK